MNSEPILALLLATDLPFKLLCVLISSQTWRSVPPFGAHDRGRTCTLKFTSRVIGPLNHMLSLANALVGGFYLQRPPILREGSKQEIAWSSGYPPPAPLLRFPERRRCALYSYVLCTPGREGWVDFSSTKLAFTSATTVPLRLARDRSKMGPLDLGTCAHSGGLDGITNACVHVRLAERVGASLTKHPLRSIARTSR